MDSLLLSKFAALLGRHQFTFQKLYHHVNPFLVCLGSGKKWLLFDSRRTAVFEGDVKDWDVTKVDSLLPHPFTLERAFTKPLSRVLVLEGTHVDILGRKVIVRVEVESFSSHYLCLEVDGKVLFRRGTPRTQEYSSWDEARLALELGELRGLPPYLRGEKDPLDFYQSLDFKVCCSNGDLMPCRFVSHGEPLQDEEFLKFWGNEILMDFLREKENRIKRAVLKRLKSALKRVRRKAEKRRAELEECNRKEFYKRLGDYIYATLSGDGLKEKKKYIFFEGEKILLDPKLTLSENAQKFYRTYKKLKKREIELRRVIEREANEVKELEKTMNAAESDPKLAEFLQHLFDGGERKKREETVRLRGVEMVEKGGWRFYIGKTVEANETLFEIMPRWSYWFHVKDYSGPHVYCVPPHKGDPLTPELEKFGAELAIKYIKKEGRFDVLCTQKRYLRKAKRRRGVLLYSREKVISAEK